jgi:hypothetical protein
MQDVLLRDSDKLLREDGMACKVSIAQLASWLAQQDAERRQRAQQAQRARRSAAAHSVAAEAPWDPCLAAVNTTCRNSGYANLTVPLKMSRSHNFCMPECKCEPCCFALTCNC